MTGPKRNPAIAAVQAILEARGMTPLQAQGAAVEIVQAMQAGDSADESGGADEPVSKFGGSNMECGRSNIGDDASGCGG